MIYCFPISVLLCGLSCILSLSIYIYINIYSYLQWSNVYYRLSSVASSSIYKRVLLSSDQVYIVYKLSLMSGRRCRSLCILKKIIDNINLEIHKFSMLTNLFLSMFKLIQKNNY